MNHWLNNRPILDNLPGFNGRYNRNPIADWITNYFDELFVDTRNSVTLIENYLNDLDNCPEEYLNFFANLAGFYEKYWDENYPVSLKIALIKKANWVFSNKGSKEVLNYVLENYGIENIITNDSDFVLGSSVVGDKLGSFPFSYLIYINPRTPNIDQLKKAIPIFVSLYGPCWCKTTVIEDFSKFVNYRVLGLYSNDTGQILSDGTQLLNASSNEELGITTVELNNVTLDYRLRAEAEGLNRPEAFWLRLNELLDSLDTDSIEYLNLFIGDTEAQKLVPVIDNSTATNQTINPDQTGLDSLELDSSSFLFIRTNGFGYALTRFSVTLQSTNRFITFLDDQVLPAPIPNEFLEINQDSGNDQLFVYGVDNYPFEYVSLTEFNGFIHHRNLSDINFNNRDIISIDRSFTKENILIGATTNNGLVGNLYYLLLGNGVDYSKNNVLISNFLLNEGVTINGFDQVYDLDLLSYLTEINTVGSSVAISTSNIIDSLIKDLINVGVYDKLQYLYLVASSDINGIGIGLFINSSFSEVITYSLETGIVLSNNQKIILENYNQSDFTTGNFTHIFSGNQSTVESRINLFGVQTGSIRYGIDIVNELNQLKMNFYGLSNTSPDVIIGINGLRNSQAISVNDSNKFEFYNNGQKVGEVTRTTPLIDNPLIIGGLKNPMKFYTFGKFDYLNQSEILSASGIIDTYNRQLGRL